MQSNDRIKLLAVDPGLTCGIALFTQHDRTIFAEETSMDGLLALLNRLGPFSHVVVERFALYPWMRKKGFDTVPAAEAIGMVRMWVLSNGPATLHRFNASVRIARVEDARAILGANAARDHARDAIAHGLTFLTVRLGFELADVLNWQFTFSKGDDLWKNGGLTDTNPECGPCSAVKPGRKAKAK
jgi:hypothetical protein